MDNQDKVLELSDEQLEQVVGGHHHSVQKTESHCVVVQHQSVQKTESHCVVVQHQSHTAKWGGVCLPPIIVFTGVPGLLQCWPQ
jgi:hypothetical protein